MNIRQSEQIKFEAPNQNTKYICEIFNWNKKNLEPKLKVGTEWVTKGQTVSQASSSVAGIAR